MVQVPLQIVICVNLDELVSLGHDQLEIVQVPDGPICTFCIAGLGQLRFFTLEQGRALAQE